MRQLWPTPAQHSGPCQAREERVSSSVEHDEPGTLADACSAEQTHVIGSFAASTALYETGEACRSPCSSSASQIPQACVPQLSTNVLRLPNASWLSSADTKKQRKIVRPLIINPSGTVARSLGDVADEGCISAGLAFSCCLPDHAKGKATATAQGMTNLPH